MPFTLLPGSSSGSGGAPPVGIISVAPAHCLIRKGTQ